MSHHAPSIPTVAYTYSVPPPSLDVVFGTFRGTPNSFKNRIAFIDDVDNEDMKVVQAIAERRLRIRELEERGGGVGVVMKDGGDAMGTLSLPPSSPSLPPLSPSSSASLSPSHVAEQSVSVSQSSLQPSCQQQSTRLSVSVSQQSHLSSASMIPSQLLHSDLVNSSRCIDDQGQIGHGDGFLILFSSDAVAGDSEIASGRDGDGPDPSPILLLLHTRDDEGRKEYSKNVDGDRGPSIIPAFTVIPSQNQSSSPRIEGSRRMIDAGQNPNYNLSVIPETQRNDENIQRHPPNPLETLYLSSIHTSNNQSPSNFSSDPLQKGVATNGTRGGARDGARDGAKDVRHVRHVMVTEQRISQSSLRFYPDSQDDVKSFKNDPISTSSPLIHTMNPSSLPPPIPHTPLPSLQTVPLSVHTLPTSSPLISLTNSEKHRKKCKLKQQQFNSLLKQPRMMTMESWLSSEGQQVSDILPDIVPDTLPDIVFQSIDSILNDTSVNDCSNSLAMLVPSLDGVPPTNVHPSTKERRLVSPLVDMEIDKEHRCDDVSCRALRPRVEIANVTRPTKRLRSNTTTTTVIDGGNNANEIEKVLIRKHKSTSNPSLEHSRIREAREEIIRRWNRPTKISNDSNFNFDKYFHKNKSCNNGILNNFTIIISSNKVTLKKESQRILERLGAWVFNSDRNEIESTDWVVAQGLCVETRRDSGRDGRRNSVVRQRHVLILRDNVDDGQSVKCLLGCSAGVAIATIDWVNALSRNPITKDDVIASLRQYLLTPPLQADFQIPPLSSRKLSQRFIFNLLSDKNKSESLQLILSVGDAATVPAFIDSKTLTVTTNCEIKDAIFIIDDEVSREVMAVLEEIEEAFSPCSFLQRERVIRWLMGDELSPTILNDIKMKK